VAATSAETLIRDFLKKYGLESLATWAWSETKKGTSFDEIKILMYDRPEFKQRFPALQELSKSKKAISVDEYVAYEKTIAQLSKQYDIPSEMYGTPAAIAKMLVNDVSAAEASQRFQYAASAAYSAPKEVRDALMNDYGMTSGELIAYWLDPDKALPQIERRYQSSQILGAARQQAVQVDKAESERLAALGVTSDAAREGFGQVADTAGLGSDLSGGETVSQQERVDAVFGGQKSRDTMSRVSASRKARFEGSSGVSADQSGVSSLGSS
jgi:hypothetical protein